MVEGSASPEYRDAPPPCRGRSTAYQRAGLSMVVRPEAGAVLLDLLLRVGGPDQAATHGGAAPGAAKTRR